MTVYWEITLVQSLVTHYNNPLALALRRAYCPIEYLRCYWLIDFSEPLPCRNKHVTAVYTVCYAPCTLGRLVSTYHDCTVCCLTRLSQLDSC